ncbi:hypothetical protein D9757_008852 [Collybiopsis confluens]|uniref:Uncharacterized protein n=1 Tax=Collybiopsis confluens TaxID=2823264 RepID=A0A8H5M0C7_9AGAR|nr:hypothetical protein D9757_008852 [Collybiopsis confluens]
MEFATSGEAGAQALINVSSEPVLGPPLDRSTYPLVNPCNGGDSAEEAMISGGEETPETLIGQDRAAPTKVSISIS